MPDIHPLPVPHRLIREVEQGLRNQISYLRRGSRATGVYSRDTEFWKAQADQLDELLLAWHRENNSNP